MKDDLTPTFGRTEPPRTAEARFCEGLGQWSRLSEAERARGAWLHAVTYSFLDAARGFYDDVCAARTSHASPSPTDVPHHRLERQLWAFFLAAKATLDALAREINLVYWALDPLKRFFDPGKRLRWVTFYTVREKVLLYGEADDPLVRLLVERTRSEAADRVYRDLSHLANASLFQLPAVVVSRPEESAGQDSSSVYEATVSLAEDFLSEHPGQERPSEVTRLGCEILTWLEGFMDEVYDRLEILVRQHP